MTRTPEQGHTKHCLAAAMICAVENARDDDGTDVDFRIWAQDNTALVWADLYLSEGTATCTCPPVPSSVCDHEPGGWDCDRYSGCPGYDTDDLDDECEGHESLRGDSMGLTVYCDGTCR